MARVASLLVLLLTITLAAAQDPAPSADARWAEAQRWHAEQTWDRALEAVEALLTAHPDAPMAAEAGLLRLELMGKLAYRSDREVRLAALEAYIERWRGTVWELRGRAMRLELLPYDEQGQASLALLGDWQAWAAAHPGDAEEYAQWLVRPAGHRGIDGRRFRLWLLRARGLPLADETRAALLLALARVPSGGRSPWSYGRRDEPDRWVPEDEALRRQQVEAYRRRRNREAAAWYREAWKRFSHTDAGRRALAELVELTEQLKDYPEALRLAREYLRRFDDGSDLREAEQADEAPPGAEPGMMDPGMMAPGEMAPGSMVEYSSERVETLASMRRLERRLVDPSVSVSGDHHDALPEQARFSLYTRNVDEVELTLYRADPFDAGSKPGEGYVPDRLTSRLGATAQRVAQWRQAVRDQGPHVPVSLDLPLPTSEPGFYLLHAAAVAHPAAADHALLNVSRLALLGLVEGDEISLRVVDRVSGRDVADAELVLERWAESEIEVPPPPDPMLMEPGIEVSLPPLERRDALVDIVHGRTGDDGVWRTPATSEDGSHYWAMARHGGQVAWLDGHLRPGLDEVLLGSRRLAGFVMTDRAVYRPGQTVQIAAVLRRPGTPPVNLPDQPVRIDIVEDWSSDEPPLHSTEARTNDYGTALAQWTVPDDQGRDDYVVRVRLGEDELVGGFRISDYRKPEVVVTARPPAEDVPPGGRAVVTVETATYDGAPLPDLPVSYRVFRGLHIPRDPFPAWTGFEWQPRWKNETDQLWTEGDTRTDAHGRATIAFGTDDTPYDQHYWANVTVTDASRREYRDQASFAVTRRSRYLFARSRRNVWRPAETVRVDVRALDPNDRAVAAELTASLHRVELVPIGDSDVGRAEAGPAVWSGRASVGADGSGEVALPAPGPGLWMLRMTAADPRAPESPAAASVAFRVAGDETHHDLPARTVHLVADRDVYTAGDTARILLLSPTVGGTVFYSLHTETAVQRGRLSLDGNQAAIEVPLGADAEPLATFTATVVAPEGCWLASLPLRVRSEPQPLAVEVVSDQETYRPRQKGRLSIRTTDPAGRPVRSQVTLRVYDRSLDALSPGWDRAEERFTKTPPFEPFYYDVPGDDAVGVSDNGQYREDWQEDALAELLARELPPGIYGQDLVDYLRGDSAGNPVRTAFPDTLLWQPTLETDDKGRLEVPLELADSLTTWGATALALTRDSRLGRSTLDLIVTQPFAVRLAAPRFLHVGDEVVLAGVLSNRTDTDQRVAVGLEAAGLAPLGDTTSEVLVPAGALRRGEARFRADAAGTAQVTVRARGETEHDAVQHPLEVVERGVPAFAAAAGRTGADGRLALNLDLPAERSAGTAALSVTVSPTVVSALLDALPWLLDRDDGDHAAVASSVLAAAHVAQVIGLMGEPSPQMERPPQAPVAWTSRRLPGLAQAIHRPLYGFDRNEDGGVGWRRGMPSSPALTALALEARLAALGTGDEDMDSVWLAARGTGYSSTPARYLLARLPELRHDPPTLAHVLAVLAAIDAAGALGPDEAQAAAMGQAFDALFAARERLDDEARARFVQALLAAGRREQAEVVWRNLQAYRTETDDSAHWGRELGVEASVETTALALLDGLALEPGSPLNDKIARWLLLNRTGNHWHNRLTTALAVRALAEYAQARGETTAGGEATLTVNGRTVQTWPVDPAAGELRAEVDPALLRDGANAIEVRHAGSGSLYVGALLTWEGSADAVRPAASHLAVERSYARLVDDPSADGGRRREPLAEGDALRAGDRVEVTLTLTADNTYSEVLLTDPRPAGLESESIHSHSLGDAWREVRDADSRLWIGHLPQGETTLRYVLRAEHPGRFHAPPVHGRGAYRSDVRCVGEEGVVEVEP